MVLPIFSVNSPRFFSHFFPLFYDSFISWISSPSLLFFILSFIILLCLSFSTQRFLHLSSCFRGLVSHQKSEERNSNGDIFLIYFLNGVQKKCYFNLDSHTRSYGRNQGKISGACVVLKDMEENKGWCVLWLSGLGH